MADNTFDPADYHRFKAETGLNDNTGYDASEFEQFKNHTGKAGFLDQMRDVVEQATEAATSAVNPSQNTGPLQISSSNPAKAAFQAAMQTFTNPGRIPGTTTAAATEIGDQITQNGISPLAVPMAIAGKFSPVADALAKATSYRGSPLLTAVQGMGAQIGLDPLTYGGAGSPSVSKQLVSPAGELAGVPFTQAESGGGTLLKSIESGLEKTPTGAGPIQEFRRVQQGKILDAVDAMKQKFGTAEDSLTSGITAQKELDSTLEIQKNFKNYLYRQIPDTPVSTPSLNQEAVKIADELSQLPKSNTPPKIAQMVKEYQDLAKPETSLINDVGQGKGVTQRTLKSITEKGVEETPLQEPAYHGGYSAQPVSPSPVRPNQLTFKALTAIRSDLGDMTTNGTGLEKMYAARMYTALNRDLNTFAENTSTPLDKMLGGEFGKTFKSANDYFRVTKNFHDEPIVQSIQRARPEDLPNIIFNGRVQDVQTAQEILGSRGFRPVQAQFFNKLVADPQIVGKVKKYNTNSPGFLETALTSEQLDAVKLMAAIRQRALAAEKMGGTYGSARTNAFTTGGLAAAGGLGSALTLAVQGHIAPALAVLGTTAAGAALPYLASRAYVGLNNGLVATMPSMASKLGGPLTGQLLRKAGEESQ